MGILNNFLHGLVDYDYYVYPGLFKKQKHTRTRDLVLDIEYAIHVTDSQPKKYDIENINI
jgi:hypothetical protein